MKTLIKKGIFIFFALGLVLSFGQPAKAQSLYVTTTNATPSSYGAVMHGSVNPNGYTTTVWFEYGTYYDLGYSNQTPHEIIGAAPVDTMYSYSAQGLQPNTTYYFRLVANNGYETQRGNISSFVTGYQQQVNQQYYYPTTTQYYYQQPQVINTQGTTEVVHNTKYIVTDTKYVQNTATQNTNTNTTVSTNQNYTNPNYVNPNLYTTTPVVSTAYTTNSNLANPLFGASFLPNTIYGWILLLILILLIVWVARRIVTA